MTDAYPSIFWQQKWLHQAYYGWRVIFDAPNFRVLAKSTGPARRCLVLSSLGVGDLTAQLRAAGLPDARTLVVLHDFDDEGQPERRISAKVWRRASDRERLLNIATFVVDLRQSEEGLWQAFGAKSRNMVRKARASGITVRTTKTPNADLDSFLPLYRPIAEKFGLAKPAAATIRQMSKNGDLLCLASVDADNRMLAVNLVYTCERHAVYLYGASVPNVVGSVGHLLQWEAICELRSRGFRWYDLGGLPSLDPNNGIHRFKKSIGGSLVHLGTEYIYCPPLIRGLQKTWPLVRSLGALIDLGKQGPF